MTDDDDHDEDEGIGDRFDKEALHYAAARGDLALVKALLAQGRPINAFDDLSRTPLHYAAANGRLDVVRHLLAAGADPNAREAERYGDTALKHVAQTCSFEMARLLVNAGADPTIPGWMGLTALNKSAQRKRGEGLDVHALLVAVAEGRNRPRIGKLTRTPKKPTRARKRRESSPASV